MIVSFTVLKHTSIIPEGITYFSEIGSTELSYQIILQDATL